jgi:hypothetical protein
MHDAATRRLETFIRSRAFTTARTDAIKTASRGNEVLAQLDAAIADLETHATAQASGARAGKERTTQRSAAFAALREDLEAINRTARAIAFSMLGLDDKFRLPRNASVQVWLAAARSFAQDAEPLKAEFVHRGLPDDFIDDLKADIGELEQSINRQAQDKGARIAATAAIDDAIERGMNALVELDVIVRNKFRNDPAALAEWTSASHVERTPRRRAPAHAQPPTPPPDAPNK